MNITLKHRVQYFSTSIINYYKVMGLESSATQRDIKQRYIQLAKKMHPDVLKNETSKSQKFAHDEFIKINQAYEVLKDQSKRREYDERASADEMEFTTHNQKTYEKSYYQKRQSDWKRETGDYQQQQKPFKIRVLTLGVIIFVCPSLLFYYSLRRGPSEHQIRRGNMLLSIQNIDSRPSTIQRRYQNALEEMKQKQFRIVQFEREVNRYGNAFISEEDMKDPKKKGKTLTTIRKKKGALESVKGITKAKPYKVTINHQQQYM